MAEDKKSNGDADGQETFSAPSISLPKGGGAIRGIGEKFAANPVTGTGSITVPIAASPGRSGFGPQLSLAYDSGSGNGLFGFGWSLSLPSITRKTDKGLPQYQDGDESDTFILSGAEDLVPVLKKQGSDWVAEDVPDRTIGTDTYRLKRYRPRSEGLFARLERWTNTRTNETHWRSISRDNVVTVYGRTGDSRIEDPHAPEGSPRVFSWLICESYDDKGNAIYYEYKREDSAGIDRSQANERNRTDKSRSANRCLKRIKYGNRTPVAHDPGLPRELGEDLSKRTDWLFEVVFDYGEGHYEELPADPEGRRFVQARLDPAQEWPKRQDPFSSCRSGFEVRTYRLCNRVLVFHHFPDELGVDDYLVRSTGFKYKEGPIASFITGVIQSGYKRQPDGTYLKKSLPPLEFQYSEAIIRDKVEDVDEESLENLPQGLDGAQYRWVDIDGEGLSGILTQQGGAWFYKRNVSALPVVGGDGKPQVVARFAPLERLATIPASTNLSEGSQQLMDLAGDGQLDVVELDSPTPGFYERSKDEAWQPFKPFVSLPTVSWQDPNLKFVDLTGDGHADLFITEDEAFTWYPSLAEIGFAAGETVRQALDEEKGPKLVFADGTQSIYLADISGDGLTDLVRIRSGEVCYWPNLGYGRFGARVTMDNAPLFDAADQFDQRRLRLADIDGSGVTDIIYLKGDGIYIYLNESGNRWAEAEKLKSFPKIDNLSSVLAVDLLGSGTACLVWSSPLPGHAHKPMRYIDLMGGQKPHLLIKTVNNLGAETHIHYAPSTKFYLADKEAGKPWITRLPFPVHVVERVETFDRISRNRFVTRYAYHHGYFDAAEREFRGFGLVEQWDTEAYAALTESRDFPTGDNIEASSHVPPVLTKTWFHTGTYLGRSHISDFFAGLLDANDTGEYYREPGLTDTQARELLLEDTVLPGDLTVDEEREACRALKGSMLRQEVYALDGTDKEPHPYTVTEQNFTIRCLQPRQDNRHGVFFTHARETIHYHYERNPEDPRVTHALTLQVDEYGNVRKSAAIGYGRRPGMSPLQGEDKNKQEQILMTYAENGVTNAIDLPLDDPDYDPDNYRIPLPCAVRTYEVTGLAPPGNASRFTFDELEKNDFEKLHTLQNVPYETPADYTKQRKRLIESLQTRYRKDDLTGLLAEGVLEPLALPGETYKLAFTPGLLDQVYARDSRNLLPSDPADILEGPGGNKGGYVDLNADGHWWIPSGQVFFHTDADVNDPANTAAEELTEARQHFFLPRKYTDPFKHSSIVDYEYDLVVITTRDALNNTVQAGYDYRVLQPDRMIDPNHNHTIVAYDALGMVAGTAVQGKIDGDGQAESGDNLDGFEPDLPPSLIDGFYSAADPHIPARDLVKDATTRIVYDMERFHKTRLAFPQEAGKWEPVFAATLVRETHVGDLKTGETTKIQINFSYSDGFGREIQKKSQAEDGPLVDGGPIVSLRWVGSGWTIFNNKGKPVRQYEPFFSQLEERRHCFEFGVEVGVSPILFYDPVERAVATLYPNHTYEKVLFGPWQQTTYDMNDTVAASGAQTGDPRTDPDIAGYVHEYFKTQPAAWETWHAQRRSGALGAQEQAAADKAAAHSDTPATAHFDTLGRTFLTVVHNKVVCPGHGQDGTEGKSQTRVELDIEGNQRGVIDAEGRVVMRYDYYMAGPEKSENGAAPNRIHQASMEAGERWMLNDVTGQPLYAWDSRDHRFRTAYDPLRRPIASYMGEGTGAELLVEQTVYGETRPDPEANNLRGQVLELFDQAGLVTSDDYDFKGNLLSSRRQLAEAYKTTLDWSAEVTLEAVTYTSCTRYDALNRPIQLIAPHSDQPGTNINVIQPGYNEANLLEQVSAWLNRSAEPTDLLDPATANLNAVTDIDYDAKGQRTLIDYGSGVRTTYEYDPLTFRLIHLQTRRGSEPLQGLSYTYDPVGNITHIRDDAQQTIYFRNKSVEPNAEYTYDALYRLIEATGREHLGQNNGAYNPPTPHSHNDAPRVGLLHRGDGSAMGTYLERYIYDAVGNFLEMQHRGSDPAHPGWTRSYAYNEASQLETAKQSNRLTSTTVGAVQETYSHDGDGYDPHGSMLKMPHLPVMEWDYRDQLRRTDLGGGGTAYYVYNADGQRVRKVWEKAPGLTEERLYLGGFEIFRRRNGAGTITLERETLHIMDDRQRIGLVETRTLDTTGGDPAPAQLIRYQLGNHLGSASLELDHQAQIISYEEYTPYGSTAYQAVRNQTETPKRYRYTGKERDEETGFYYHGARCYAPWLGRWSSADPAGLVDGVNLFAFVRNNPVNKIDPEGRNSKKPLYSDWFEEVVFFVFEGLEDFNKGRAASRKVTLDKAIFLIIQAYGEQAPSKGRPSLRHYRMFNIHPLMQWETDPGTGKSKIKRGPSGEMLVQPGQEAEGVAIDIIGQGEGPTNAERVKKDSPTFVYWSGRRSVSHTLEVLENRYSEGFKRLIDQEQLRGINKIRNALFIYAKMLQLKKYGTHEKYAEDLRDKIFYQVIRELRNWIDYRLEWTEKEYKRWGDIKKECVKLLEEERKKSSPDQRSVFSRKVLLEMALESRAKLRREKIWLTKLKEQLNSNR